MADQAVITSPFVSFSTGTIIADADMNTKTDNGVGPDYCGFATGWEVTAVCFRAEGSRGFVSLRS